MRSSAGARAVRSRASWLRPALIVGAGMLIVAAVLIVWWLLPTRAPTGAEVESLAVLPLVNLKDPEDPERLGQILQELIIADLSGLANVKVFSSERLLDIRRQFGSAGGRTIDPELAPSIAARAGATTMLTGSLSQLGDRSILTYRLVNVADGSVLNSDRIPGGATTTLAAAISRNLSRRFSRLSSWTRPSRSPSITWPTSTTSWTGIAKGSRRSRSTSSDPQTSPTGIESGWSWRSMPETRSTRRGRSNRRCDEWMTTRKDDAS